MKRLLLIAIAVTVVTFTFALLVSADEHNLNESYIYENGFKEKGVYSCTCTDEGCDYTLVEEREPLFDVQGFSTPSDTESFRGINFGYQANLDAINEYERINSVDLQYGFLISNAEKFVSSPKDIINMTFERDNGTIDIKLNYGDALTGSIYNNSDIIFAGTVEERLSNGEVIKTYLQVSDGDERAYTNDEYGTLYGTNYSYITRELTKKIQLIDNCAIEDSTGNLGAYSGNARVSISNYIKVNKGDTISVPKDSGYIFLFYAYYYDYDLGEYVYSRYMDLDPTSSSNWNYTFTFQEGTKDASGRAFDYENDYIRILFKSSDYKNSPIYAEDIRQVIRFNMGSEPFEPINITYEIDGTTKVARAKKGQMLGELYHPTKEGHYFAGWYAKSDKNFENVYTDETVASSDLYLVAKWTKAEYEWQQDMQIHDGTGSLQDSTQGRVLISSFIKVKPGDSIHLDRNCGYRFIIYCYRGEEHQYENNAYVDCFEYDASSKNENWGHQYTFGDTILLGNGNTIDTEGTYIRIVFDANAGKAPFPITIDEIKSAVRLNFSNNE